MKKSYKKLIVFNFILIIFFILNNFIWNILNYKISVLLLGLLIVLDKYMFGLEKDNHRFLKDIVFNILIIILTFFILFYLLGLIIGFVRTTDYYSLYGFINIIIPYILVIILKEYLRYQLISKAGNNKLIIVLLFITFLLFDITGKINVLSWKNHYDVFMFFALTFLPALSCNATCFYISKKVGYKPNILWQIIFNLYGILLPIVPKTGLYIGTMINFLFPIILLYNVYAFFNVKKGDIPLRENKFRGLILFPTSIAIILTIIYFTSGYFKYYSVAIASGSMIPKIYKGDVVIVDKKYNHNKLKEGQIIAYKFENRIIVHRLVDIQKVGDINYFYTKGDANNAKDNYIVYDEMILGVVNHKIPYIGLPTVWLNEL